MNKRILLLVLLIPLWCCQSAPVKTDRRYEQALVPAFWKNTLTDVRDAVRTAKRGETRIVARTPGGHPVYLVSYGEKRNFRRQANYQSATGARDPRYYANKPEGTPPIVFVLGTPHGQEIENIVGTINLIRVAETGKDWRGKEWQRLKENIERCRLLIVPLSNPDGRARCPYDSFVSIPTEEMTRVGQGTRKDGSLYGWPGAKAVHPMKGDVGSLGAYFDDNGINLMHDDFFDPMSKVTKALLDIAREEAPDYIVNLHSHENDPVILETEFVPRYCKEIEAQFAERLMQRYRREGLPAGSPPEPSIDGEKYPPPSFNLSSALHHVCGGVSFVFECCHGTEGEHAAKATHDRILDIELTLFDELLQFAVEAPRPEMRRESQE